MKKSYNEKLEKEIDEILNPLNNGLGYDVQFLFEQLYNKYKETNYPGFIYTIGLLIERNIIKSNNSKTHISYYSDAANQHYLPALMKLNEYCLDKINYEITLNSLWFNQHRNHQLMIQDAYGKYLLAKFNMIKCINDNTLDEYFMDALSLMKESADSGCEEAIQFMKFINIEGIHEVIK